MGPSYAHVFANSIQHLRRVRQLAQYCLSSVVRWSLAGVTVRVRPRMTDSWGANYRSTSTTGTLLSHGGRGSSTLASSQSVHAVAIPNARSWLCYSSERLNAKWGRGRGLRVFYGLRPWAPPVFPRTVSCSRMKINREYCVISQR